MNILLLVIGPIGDTLFTTPSLKAVHPGGSYFSMKRWPAPKFKKLLKIMDRYYRVQFVLLGGNTDKSIVKKIIDKNYDYNFIPVDFTGELTLSESAALLEYCDIFLGNDSAPQHIAASVQIPVITLFGPTNPNNFHPYGTEYKIIRAENIDCSPCFYWLGSFTQYLPQYLPEFIGKCNHSCMKKITVDQVIDALKIFLSRNYRNVTV